MSLGAAVAVSLLVGSLAVGCGVTEPKAQAQAQATAPVQIVEPAKHISGCGVDVPDARAAAYIGKTEAEAEALASRQGRTVRVTGRDGECIVGDKALIPNRVNVLVVDGRVILARLG